MDRNLLKALILIIPVIAVSGCSTFDRAYTASKERINDFETRGYVQDKLRVDQDMAGNAGYLYGDPKPEDRSDYKKTRKIYVLEVSEKSKLTPEEQAQLDMNEPMISTTSNIKPRQTPPPRRVIKTTQVNQKVDIPDLDSVQVNENDVPNSYNPVTPGGLNAKEVTSKKVTQDAYTEDGVKYVDYVVEKNDTLQKISKKFYDGYSKWPKIYEANKSTLKSPDSIKPGMTIRVPVEN